MVLKMTTHCFYHRNAAFLKREAVVAALFDAFPQFPTFTHYVRAGGWSLGAAGGFVGGGVGKVAGFWGW